MRRNHAFIHVPNPILLVPIRGIYRVDIHPSRPRWFLSGAGYGGLWCAEKSKGHRLKDRCDLAYFREGLGNEKSPRILEF